MADSPDKSLTLKAQCSCGFASFTVEIPSSAIPLKSAICSCNSCRRATSQLFGTFVVVPGLPLPDVSQLTSYKSSDRLTRVFCPRCGCSVLNHEKDEWEFTSGVLEGPVDGILDRQALFADDSLDGGGYIWLPEKNGAGNEIKFHSAHRDSEVVDIEAMRRSFETKKMPTEADQNDKLHVSCHCGAFECSITRPDQESPGPTPGHGKWWLAKDGHRFAAGLDACRMCRKVTGYEIGSWAYIPAFNFTTPDGAPLDPATHPALHHYDSSPGVHRDFCATCGSSIFFRKDSRNPQVWDIAVGLLHGRGARAEDWLEWNGLDFESSALDVGFATAISEAMRDDKAKRQL